MLKSNERYVLFFDLLMTPYPADAPPVPLADFIPHLKKRVDDSQAHQVIDNGRRTIRLLKYKDVILSDGMPALALLFSLGDVDKADPGFTNLLTGGVRVVSKRKDEAGGLSVHALICLNPIKKRGQTYRMLYEDIAGFGRTLIQAFLRAQFREIAEDQNLTFTRAGSRDQKKTRPMVELAGHASETLRESLRVGRLQHVELVTYREVDLGFDEDVYVKNVRRDISFSVANSLPDGDGLGFVERVKEWAKNNEYEIMRVRWKEPGLSKPRTAKVDTARLDAGEAMFVKASQVSLSTRLPDISGEISDELVDKMASLLKGD